MEIPFYSTKDYTIDSVNGVCLCRCNNCGLILIDENPQVDAPKYQLKGTEENMELAEHNIHIIMFVLTVIVMII